MAIIIPKKTAAPLEGDSTARPPAYPALLLTQNEHRFYFATIPIDDLFAYCYVARRDEDTERGFQRTLSQERAESIAQYLASGTGSIPSNIVLSAQEVAELKYDSRTKSISFQRNKNSFLVLDGQHRLWGYSKCKTRHRVPVAIYDGLTRTEEARLFIDINTNQKGVPAALLLDIKRLAERENDQEQRLRELFDQLGSDSRSALAGKLSNLKSVSGKISRVTFNRSVGGVLSAGTFAFMTKESQYQLIRNFINAIDAELDDKTLLVRSSFFEAIFELMDEVVRLAKSRFSDVKQVSLQQALAPAVKIDFTKLDVSKSKVTKRHYLTAMQAALRMNIEISDDDL